MGGEERSIGGKKELAIPTPIGSTFGTLVLSCGYVCAGTTVSGCKPRSERTVARSLSTFILSKAVSQLLRSEDCCSTLLTDSLRTTVAFCTISAARLRDR